LSEALPDDFSSEYLMSPKISKVLLMKPKISADIIPDIPKEIETIKLSFQNNNATKNPAPSIRKAAALRSDVIFITSLPIFYFVERLKLIGFLSNPTANVELLSPDVQAKRACGVRANISSR
jgi:hypothetical protein